MKMGQLEQQAEGFPGIHIQQDAMLKGNAEKNWKFQLSFDTEKGVHTSFCRQKLSHDSFLCGTGGTPLC